MKLSLELGEALEPAIQKHLSDGYAVQDYMIRALELFNFLRAENRRGAKVGIAEPEGHSQYWTEPRYSTVDIWSAGKPEAPQVESAGEVSA